MSGVLVVTSARIGGSQLLAGALIVLLLSAIGALILARKARGQYPRFSSVRWPGRRMALAGAFLSWVALAFFALIAIIAALVAGTIGGMSGDNLL